MSANQQLLPCPFCGREPYRTESVNGSEMLYIGCSTCGVAIKAKKIHYPGRTEWSRDIAAVWNSRGTAGKIHGEER